MSVRRPIVWTVIAVLVAGGFAGAILLHTAAPLASPSDERRDPLPAAFISAGSHESGEILIDLSSASYAGPTLVVAPAILVQLGRGWTAPEEWGAWAVGDRAELFVNFAHPAERTMLIRGWALDHPGHPDGQRVTVALNGHECGTVTIGTRKGNDYLKIPADAQISGLNTVELSFAFSVSPSEIGRGTDERRLAVGFCAIGFANGSVKPRPRTRWTRAADQIRRFLGLDSELASHDPHAGTVTVRGPGMLVIRLPEDRPPGAAELVFRTDRSPLTELPAITTIVHSLDSVIERDARIPADSWDATPGGSTTSLELDLDGVGDGFIVVHVPEDVAGSALSVDSPLLLGKPLNEVPSPAATPPAPGLEPPDVVLITLDAARTDRFGCYGYHRETTPAIDQLAGESLVFRNAFALAPYTLCSVPTMITGWSFLNHGVLFGKQALEAGARTLAEELHDLGYQTAAFSATPNNSRSKGFAQGYETFVERWRDTDPSDALDPHLMAAQVTDWLAARADSRPLHLQLHFVPPHEPYEPPPRFNRFADPAYDGTLDGTVAAIDAVNLNRVRPTSGDVAYMSDLYDGNLARADHAVGLVLDVLRQRARWDRTIVLVTSDHGEAFYEHGQMGHNSTVYDEMLRVPFILRLPPGVPYSPVPTDSLISLADLTPTLLAAAGGRPDLRLDGVNLMATDTPVRPRDFLVLRTDRRIPTLAIRTSTRKLILEYRNLWSLFDVVNDPDELVNITPTNQAEAVGLALHLWHRLREPPALGVGAPTAVVDDQDAAMLRALGYTD